MKINDLPLYDQKIAKSRAFESFVCSMFKKWGFEVESEVKRGRFSIDLVIRNGEYDKYICEIKYSSNLHLSSSIFESALNTLTKFSYNEENKLLITNALCSEECRRVARELNIDIIDLSNLIYMLKSNKTDYDLYQCFLELLNYSISNVLPKIPNLKMNLARNDYNYYKNTYMFDQIKDKDNIKTWRKKFKTHEANIGEFVEYENLCIEALKLLFSDSLGIWKKQQKSNDDLYRFDLICKTKSDIKDDFFWTINNYFNTRYIVFEFKDYTNKITQREIYTTEKYLYDKALRKVAIIISNYGEDRNANKAIKGTLREQGKLIISLNNNDILKMIEIYYREGDPSLVTDYLSKKLDSLLIELEK